MQTAERTPREAPIDGPVNARDDATTPPVDTGPSFDRALVGTWTLDAQGLSREAIAQMRLPYPLQRLRQTVVIEPERGVHITTSAFELLGGSGRVRERVTVRGQVRGVVDANGGRFRWTRVGPGVFTGSHETISLTTLREPVSVRVINALQGELDGVQRYERSANELVLLGDDGARLRLVRAAAP